MSKTIDIHAHLVSSLIIIVIILCIKLSSFKAAALALTFAAASEHCNGNIPKHNQNHLTFCKIKNIFT